MINKIFNKIQLLVLKIQTKKFNVRNIHLSESHIVSSGRYFSCVAQIIKSNKNFFNFKINPIYNVVLEHVGKKEGLNYINFIKKSKFGRLILKNISIFKINDSVGNPKLYNYSDIEKISPTTLRYVATLVDIYNIFGRKSFYNILELGAGYGGQFLCFDQVFKIKKYYLFDYFIVCDLIKKYLKCFKINTEYKTLTVEKNFFISRIDFFLSNYAFSELPKILQKKYLYKYIKKSKNGYMVMNSGKKESSFNENHYSLAELKEYLPKFKIKKDISNVPGNYIIYWKN